MRSRPRLCCVCVLIFSIMHVASFVVVFWSRSAPYADLSTNASQEWGDGRVVLGMPLEEKLYTRQLHSYSAPPAVSSLHIQSCPVMLAVNGDKRTRTPRECHPLLPQIFFIGVKVSKSIPGLQTDDYIRLQLNRKLGSIRFSF